MSVRRRVQDENVASYRRSTVSVSRKTIDQNAKVTLPKSAATPASGPKPDDGNSKDAKAASVSKNALGDKRAALGSLSNGTAQAARPPIRPSARPANTASSTATKTPARKGVSKTPGKAKKTISIYTPARPAAAQRQAVSARTEDDEVEYMPPTAVDLPHQPLDPQYLQSQDNDLFDISAPAVPSDFDVPPDLAFEDERLDPVDIDDFRFEN